MNNLTKTLVTSNANDHKRYCFRVHWPFTMHFKCDRPRQIHIDSMYMRCDIDTENKIPKIIDGIQNVTNTPSAFYSTRQKRLLDYIEA